MTFPALLVGSVDFCRRNALSVVFAAVLLVIFSGWYAAGHLGITTETDEMFAASLPWRQRAEMFKKLFPQFQDLLVAVIDAKEPEEADAAAASLAKALAGDREHFLSVRRPDASPFLEQEGLLYLDTPQLESLVERMIDAQPFLGELAKDPSARGLFDALSLLGTGVEQGQVNLAPYRTALAGFHDAMTSALAGHPHPLSWVRLLGGELADLGGRYKFVLVQPKLDHTTLEPGGAATRAMRDAANKLEFVKSGEARVRITGNVALAELPRTATGKIDRQALPAPGAERPGLRAYVAPRTAVEEVLAGMVAELLGRQQVGITDDFFDLGGHSLLAAQLAALVRDNLQVELPLSVLFADATVAGFAAFLGRERERQPALEEAAGELLRVAEMSDAEAERELQQLWGPAGARPG